MSIQFFLKKEWLLLLLSPDDDDRTKVSFLDTFIRVGKLIYLDFPKTSLSFFAIKWK